MDIERQHWNASFVLAGVLTALTLQSGWAQAVAFQRGERVREKIVTLPTEPKRIGMAVTVVAQPGDEIETRLTTILVNGRPITGFSAELIATAAGSPRLPDRMRHDQYLVMGESKDPLNNVVRKWGVYSGSALEPAGD